MDASGGHAMVEFSTVATNASFGLGMGILTWSGPNACAFFGEAIPEMVGFAITFKSFFTYTVIDGATYYDSIYATTMEVGTFAYVWEFLSDGTLRYHEGPASGPIMFQLQSYSSPDQLRRRRLMATSSLERTSRRLGPSVKESFLQLFDFMDYDYKKKSKEYKKPAEDVKNYVVKGEFAKPWWKSLFKDPAQKINKGLEDPDKFFEDTFWDTIKTYTDKVGDFMRKEAIKLFGEEIDKKGIFDGMSR
jgi:hypothetical protein